MLSFFGFYQYSKLRVLLLSISTFNSRSLPPPGFPTLAYRSPPLSSSSKASPHLPIKTSSPSLPPQYASSSYVQSIYKQKKFVTAHQSTSKKSPQGVLEPRIRLSEARPLRARVQTKGKKQAKGRSLDLRKFSMTKWYHARITLPATASLVLPCSAIIHLVTISFL